MLAIGGVRSVDFLLSFPRRLLDSCGYLYSFHYTPHSFNSVMSESRKVQSIAGSIQSLPSAKAPKRALQYWSVLKILTWLQLGLAISMILLASIMHTVISIWDESYSIAPCDLATGIWVGVLAVIAAGLGIAAFRSASGDKCLVISHFVMTIICAVADGVLIIISSFCLNAICPTRRYRGARTVLNPHVSKVEYSVTWKRGLIANQSLLLVAAIAHFIIAIVATSFICCNWCHCQDSEPPVAVVYYPAADGMHAKCSRVDVPSGAQVIFVPLNSGKQVAKSPAGPSESA